MRRWIANGRLAATKTDGPYGQQYDVATEDVQAVQAGLAVVTRTQPVDLHTLAWSIAEALATRDKETAAAINRLTGEVEQLRREVEGLRNRRRWPWVR